MTQPRRPDPHTVAVILPLHRLHENGAPVVVRRPGRPRRVESAPTISEAEYHQAIARAAALGIEQDSVVAASASDPKSIIEKTMIAVAEEAAALRWDRERAQREGRAEAERISSRRVSALMRLAELAVVREELRHDDPEPEPAHVAKILDMLVAEVEAAVRETASPDVAEKFLNAVKVKLAASSLASTGAAAGRLP